MECTVVGPAKIRPSRSTRGPISTRQREEKLEDHPLGSQDSHATARFAQPVETVTSQGSKILRRTMDNVLGFHAPAQAVTNPSTRT